MIIFSYFVFCISVFYQFPFGQARVLDRMRIVNGDFAAPGEIKYIVVTFHDDQYYMCGGGILDNYHVLTAAHCFIDDENHFANRKIKVVAGTNDYTNNEDPRRIEVEVEKVYILKKYDIYEYIYDIAVIKLKKSLNIRKNDLQALSLPTKAHNLTNRMALMAGFGHDEHKVFVNLKGQWEEQGSSSGILRKADVLMFNNNECQEIYVMDKIYGSNVCGKMVKRSQAREYGLCNGDSGSPLVLNSGEVVGIVSWSYGCDERDVPLVYTRVINYINFIQKARMDIITRDMSVKVYE